MDALASLDINIVKHVDTEATCSTFFVYSNHTKVWLMFELISGRGRNLAVGVQMKEEWKTGETSYVYLNLLNYWVYIFQSYVYI